MSGQRWDSLDHRTFRSSAIVIFYFWCPQVLGCFILVLHSAYQIGLFYKGNDLKGLGCLGSVLFCLVGSS
jgi:hypothetical protein